MSYVRHMCGICEHICVICWAYVWSYVEHICVIRWTNWTHMLSCLQTQQINIEFSSYHSAFIYQSNLEIHLCRFSSPHLHLQITRTIFRGKMSLHLFISRVFHVWSKTVHAWKFSETRFAASPVFSESGARLYTLGNSPETRFAASPVFSVSRARLWNSPETRFAAFPVFSVSRELWDCGTPVFSVSGAKHASSETRLITSGVSSIFEASLFSSSAGMRSNKTSSSTYEECLHWLDVSSETRSTKSLEPSGVSDWTQPDAEWWSSILVTTILVSGFRSDTNLSGSTVGRRTRDARVGLAVHVEWGSEK